MISCVSSKSKLKNLEKDRFFLSKGKGTKNEEQKSSNSKTPGIAVGITMGDAGMTAWQSSVPVRQGP